MKARSDSDTLRYGVTESRMGIVLVAATQQGMAAILFGRIPARLKQELAAAFPNAERIEDALALRATLAAVVALLNDPRTGFDEPLDLRGSALELAVWGALRAIPPGETRSYGELTRTLSVKVTAQEVGAACAASVLAAAIPCHRVLKVDGSISGYRWGTHLKRRLLALEAAA